MGAMQARRAAARRPARCRVRFRPARRPSVPEAAASSPVLDHGTGPQLLEIALALLGEPLLQDLFANLALAGQLAGDLPLAAQCIKLDALLRLFRRGELAFRRVVQDLAQL